MRREADFFGEDELRLVYMARRLKDALGLEEDFSAAGVDYLVETGTYTAGFLMKRDLAGAFFYVAEKDVPSSHEVLAQTKRKPYQPDE